MCGIAGLALRPGASKVSALDAIRRMPARMHTRGPETQGGWAGEGVDARPYGACFKDGMGKTMLANAPERSLPEAVVNRPKAGFGVPITSWLSEWSGHHSWTDLPLIVPSGTPWSNRWAGIVAG